MTAITLSRDGMVPAVDRGYRGPGVQGSFVLRTQDDKRWGDAEPHRGAGCKGLKAKGQRPKAKGSALQAQGRRYRPLLGRAEAEAGAHEQVLHIHIFREHCALKGGDAFHAGDLDHAFQQQAA